MQFPVPQFIDIEDKIIGPFTLKQFGFIFGGGVLIAALFRILQLSVIFFFLAVPIALISIAFAFGQFNGKPLYNSIPIFMNFLTSPKRMVFHKDKASVDDLDIKAIMAAPISVAPQEQPIVEEPASKLHRLSMLLDQKAVQEIEIVNPNQTPNNNGQGQATN